MSNSFVYIFHSVPRVRYVVDSNGGEGGVINGGGRSPANTSFGANYLAF